MKRKRLARSHSRKKTSTIENGMTRVQRVRDEDYFQNLSLEVICLILGYLPLRYILRMDCMNHKLRNAVSMFLRIQKEIDMSERDIYGWMCDTLTDSTLTSFLKRCHDVEYLYGFHPGFMTLRRQRGADMLTLPGIIDALSECKNLKGIEISDVVLLHAMMDFFPQLEILGTFKNRNGTFPINCSSSLTLAENAKITSLNLNGIVIENLPKMYNLRHLQLRWVHFHESHPFSEFMAPKLQTFVMAHCSGPVSAIKYVPLIASLASSRYLSRLELLRVPFLGGLIHHVVQDSWQMNAFRQLRCIRFGACRHALEMDLGFLIITAAQKIEEVSVQPSLTKDNLFVALMMADVSFPSFNTLHLGFVDSFPAPDKWDNEDLIVEGLANVSEAPAVITDIGMRAVAVCFPRLKHLDIYNCPHILRPTQWFTQGLTCWDQLTDLSLRRCHALKIEDFCEFIPTLPSLQTLYLEQMFREPPKGCSRVGLSAGTGMGLSSAMLNQHYQNPPPANPVVNNNNVQDDGANQNEGGNAAANQNNDLNVQNDGSNAAGNQGNDMNDDPANQINDMIDDPANQNNDMNDAPANQNNDMNDAPINQNNDNQNNEREHDEVDEVAVDRRDEADEDACDEASEEIMPENKEKEDDFQGENMVQNLDGHDESETVNTDNSNTSAPTTSMEISKNMEESSDCPQNEKCNAVNESEQISNVNNSESEECEKEDIKNDNATSSSQSLPENTCSMNKKSEKIQRAPFSPTPRMRPTRSCVKHQRHNSGKSDRTSTDRKQNDQNVHSAPVKRRKLETNQNIPEESSERCEMNEDGAESNAKVMQMDSSQCQKCLCNRSESERKYSKRRKLRHRKSKGKRKPVCKCECHSDEQRDKLSDHGTENKDQEKKAMENSTWCPLEKQDSADTCDVKKEVKEEKEVEKVDKSCEAKPEEIRQSLSQAEDSTTRKGKKRRGRQSKQGHYEGPKSNMRDECTSTADPLVEEDHVQILKLKSNSLISLSLNNVGITCLVLDECPQLSKLSGHACRVLKEVKLNAVPKIRKVEFTHCPKLSEENLAYEVALQEETLADGQARRYNKALFLRPMHMIDKGNLEHLLFSSPDIPSDICIIYDYNDQACNSSYNHMRVFTWGEILTPLASELIDVYSFLEWSRKDWKPSYPWGRDIFRMYERNGNLTCHEIVTDMTLMRILKEKPRLPENQIHRFDHARGIYCPNTKGHYSAYSALDSIMDEMADQWCAGMKVRRHSCIIYINLSDINGVPTYDPEFS
ncbi:F-box only protein 38-like [Saccostrea echinata]|uniref:F-box only protein 38-like n=1 Tax=Saccostrea echinata TaxID=191078 RepID=UPI002A81C5F7|nr:F-box only protein 38-like [Saccostrea echinata]